MRRCLLLVLLFLVVLSPAPAATARAAAGNPGPSGPSGHDVPPLVRAVRALNGDGQHPEATVALRDLFVAKPRLDGFSEDFASALLARPTDGADDPFVDGYSVPSQRTCGTKVCVHWVRTTRDAPPDRAWVDTTLATMQKVWRHHVRELGYRRPAADGTRGGDARFDVYLKELGSEGLYGYCAPERRVKGEPQQASGFCVLDDDFARNQFGRPPMQTLRVTAAHEFFHAVQFAYDYAEDPWLLESTATWMEEQFADSVDDNRAYLGFGQLARPGVPLDLFDSGGYGHYGNWPFWQFVTDRYGVGVVKQVIRRTGTGNGLPDEFSTLALRRVLADHGGLRRVFAAYAAGNTVPGRTYPEGASYRPAPVTTRTMTSSAPFAFTARVNHLSSRSVTLRPGRALRGEGRRLRVAIDAPDAASSPAAYVVISRTDGRLQGRVVPLDAAGRGLARIGFDPRTTRWVTVTLANASTRYRCGRATLLACQGISRDDRRRFGLTASVSG